MILVEELISKKNALHFLEITGGMLTHFKEKGKIEYEVFEASEALSSGEVLSLEEKFLAGQGQNITPARYAPNSIDRQKISDQVKEALKGAARAILERFGGQVPARMEDLVTLPGVGRKTANVLRGHVFGEAGLVVDTHVRRVAHRLGLTRETDPEKIERDLQKLLEPAEWTPFSMRLILHGRAVCHARKPRCDVCMVAVDCPRIGVAQKPQAGTRTKKSRAGASKNHV